MLLEGNKYDFKTDQIHIFSINADESGSMESHREGVISGLKRYRQEFEEFYLKKSIAIGVNYFSTRYSPSTFSEIEKMNISYYPNGGTALYDAIVEGSKNLLDYVNEVIKRTGCIPRATFIVLSDGEDNSSKNRARDARNAIEKLNSNNIDTVFIAFGNAIRAKDGKKLGFMATKDVSEKNSIEKFLGEELSKSCKEQSKSLKSLGSNFFSQAPKSKSSYSAKTEQILNIDEDDDWF